MQESGCDVVPNKKDKVELIFFFISVFLAGMSVFCLFLILSSRAFKHALVFCEDKV